MKRAFTLIEAMVAVAILATLIGLLLPAFSAARSAVSRRDGEPRTTWRLETVQHDGHRWVIARGTPVFGHHPDCPCSGRVER